MPVVNSQSEWSLDSQETRVKRGPLIKVEISHGRFVKMYRADAIARGYIKGEKMKTPPKNKMIDPAGFDDKGAPGPFEIDQTESGPPDFSVIPGVGKGAARALVSHGILSFEDLENAGELEYLTPKVNQAIRAYWEDFGG